jgi:hypothetical protein
MTIPGGPSRTRRACGSITKVTTPPLSTLSAKPSSLFGMIAGVVHNQVPTVGVARPQGAQEAPKLPNPTLGVP